MSRFAFYLRLALILALSVSLSNAQRPVATLFEEAGDVPCGDYQLRIDLLLAKATETESTGVIIFYEGKYEQTVQLKNGEQKRIVAPVFGEAQERVRWLHNYLNSRRAPRGLVRFVSGEFRDRFSMDFWIVPKGADSPKPSRTVDFITYRRGEPSYFYCV